MQPSSPTSDNSASPPPQSGLTNEASARKAHILIRFWHNIRSLVVMIVVLFALRSCVADWNDVPTGSMIPSILDGDRIFVNKLSYDLKIPFTGPYDVPFTDIHFGHPVHIATWANPQHGDVVVFFSPDDGTRLVKRCIAISGDTIEVRDNHLIINGQAMQYGPALPSLTAHAPLDTNKFDYETETLGTHVHLIQKFSQSYLYDPRNRLNSFSIEQHRSWGPEKVPEGKYFMMGDNRDLSRDSRYFTAGPWVPRGSIVGRATDVVISLDIDHNWWPRWSRFFTKLP